MTLKSKLAKLLQWLERYESQCVTAICSFVILAGIFYSYHLGDYLQYPDERDYIHLARNIISYRAYTLDGLHATASRPPGYPFVLSLLAAAGMSETQMRIFNFFLLAGSIALLSSVLKSIHNRLSGIIAAILLVGYPVLFYTAGIVVPQTMGMFLLLLAVRLTVASKGSPLCRYFLAGIAWGVHLLAIPGSVFALGIFLLWPPWHARSIKGLRYSLVLLVGTALIVAPWMMRNNRVFGKSVLISTNSGMNLLLGNNENATPSGGATIRIARYWQMAKGLNEAQQDSLLGKKAIEFITKNKLQSLKMYFLKILNHFNFTNQLGAVEESSRARDIIMLVTYGPLLTLFVLRLVSASEFSLKREEIFFLAIYFGGALFYAVYFTRIRFRVPFDSLLIAVVAMFIVNVLERQGYPFFSPTSNTMKTSQTPSKM